MQVLILNCGSSSIKSAVIDTESRRRVADVRLEGLGEQSTQLRIDGDASPLAPIVSYSAALAHVLEALDPNLRGVAAVGHRVVHGGQHFVQPTLIDDAVCAAIEALIPLAPLHNEACLAGIRATREMFPDLPHVAAFDTSFHASVPPHAASYALPGKLAAELGIRRYGFHGISHEYVAQAAAAYVSEPLSQLKVISCHLGNGCSMAAVEYGRCIDTTMGMTPLEGLVMGTRSGDLDPGVVLHLLKAGHLSVAEVDDLLNRESGLQGICGMSSMQHIEQAAARGDGDARLAIALFCHRILKYIGAYTAIMGGVDVILFTGGIGEHSAFIRARVAGALGFLGVRFDEDRNQDAQVSVTAPVHEISKPGSHARVLVVATDEEVSIADSTSRLLSASAEKALTVPVAISARHVHLQRSTIAQLFGADHELTKAKDLSQPGQYAAHETLTLIGPAGTIESVRVLGPPRDEDQVEISRTDEIHLGLDAPVHASGDLKDTPGITLQGPNGQVVLERGVICAWRHIHMTPADAGRWRVSDGDTVAIRMGAAHRHVVFRDVLIRVSPKYRLEMHIDTDEANAADLAQDHCGELVEVTSRANAPMAGEG